MIATRAVALLALAASSLAGCVGAAVGAGATVATAASEERGLGNAADDTRIRVEINSLWLDKSEELYRKVDLDVVEGRVLLTGIVPTREMRRDAVRLAGRPSGVKEVIDEIAVGEKRDLAAYARDRWITTELEARLVFDKRVLSINYSVETVSGMIYVIGIAQDRAELDRVLAHARDIAYVKGVVSFVRLKDDLRRGRT